MAKDDGGPAFPQVETDASECREIGQHYSHVYSYGGMSLRDYFAGQALTGLLASGSSLVTFENYAHCAFEHADAMLVKRAEKA